LVINEQEQQSTKQNKMIITPEDIKTLNTLKQKYGSVLLIDLLNK